MGRGRLRFFTDSTLEFLAGPFIWLAELAAFGSLPSAPRSRRRRFEQDFETEQVPIEVKAEMSAKGRGRNAEPNKIETLTVSWDGETVLKWFGLSIAYAQFIRFLNRADGKGFDKIQELVSNLSTPALDVKGTSKSESIGGTDGADRFAMGGGDDRIDASRGRDEIDGGAGPDDQYSGEILNRALTVDLKRGFAKKKGAGRDTLENIEDVVGSNRDDKLRGDGKANNLEGRNGDDQLVGRGGGDVLRGEQGNDRIFGGPGSDELYGGDDNDRLDGGSRGDSLYGGEGDDTLEGGPGTDALFGGPGADEFIVDPQPDPEAPDTIFDYDPDEGDVIRLSGDRSEYTIETFVGGTRILRNNEPVVVIENVLDPDVLDDALFL
ncbi:MAG: calcium-binding protein [Pseudomonadota bacterium]